MKFFKYLKFYFLPKSGGHFKAGFILKIPLGKTEKESKNGENNKQN